MTDELVASASPESASGRPTELLPNRELVRISLYWLGLSSIFAGLSFIIAGRLEFTGLVHKAGAGRAWFLVSVRGALHPGHVPPTPRSISPQTIVASWRRQSYNLL